jgi:hypothetical protein
MFDLCEVMSIVLPPLRYQVVSPVTPISREVQDKRQVSFNGHCVMTEKYVKLSFVLGHRNIFEVVGNICLKQFVSISSLSPG